LSKDWYVYFSFRNPENNRLTRQSNIKAGVNRHKTKEERIEFLKTIQDRLLYLLKLGFNPYEDNSTLEEKLESKDQPIKKEKIKPDEEKEPIPIENELSIREAFEFGLKIKKNVLGATSFNGFNGRINRFLKWLDENEGSKKSVSSLNKKVFNNYLNFVLENTSASNRNNTRTDLSSLVQTLVDNEVMKENFIKSINVLKSAPERNKTYSQAQEIDILKYLEENDAILLLFIQFIYYNFIIHVLIKQVV
jgi:hypothetical protein